MGIIRILPELMINKIAAGEVVERPASVVKELVENSIDAGSDQIIVTIKNGGKDYISVLDNGKGMSPEDAKLAIERHATSKIRDVEDLNAISTMGFRGEALAAISSVSRFEITTCCNEDQGGYRINMEGGKILTSGKVGFPLGTRMTVQNLFFNTPARQKFMKAVKTEFGHIVEVMERLSLGNPSIQFRLTHNQALSLNHPKGQSFEQRVKTQLGDALKEDLLEFHHEESDIRFIGLFSKPSDCGASKRYQYTFVNDRYVRYSSINHAVYQGYKTLLMKNCHPSFFLRIYLSPDEIDVNVHPAKTEIRFKNQALVHTVLANEIHRQLKHGSRKLYFNDETPNLEASQSPLPPPNPEVENESKDPQPKTPVSSLPNNIPETGSGKTTPSVQQNKKKKPSLPSIDDPDQMGFLTKNKSNSSKAIEEENSPFSFSERETEEVEQLKSDQYSVKSSQYQVLAQFNQKYIMAQSEDRLLLIDQHAAHERIRFEEIRESYYNRSLVTQTLAAPQLMKLSPQDGILLEQNEEYWGQLGFSIQHFGGNDYSVSEVPVVIQEQDIPTLIRTVLNEMAQFGKSGKMEEFFNEVFEKIACHSAIRAGQDLSHQEMQKLVDQLQNLDIHIHCPHGRPVLVEFSINELDKKFKRIV